MKMDRMVEYLENRGFKVEKKYLPGPKLYDFTIFKHGIETHGYFEYPAYAKDTPEMDKIQIHFLESLIADWESRKSVLNDTFGPDVAEYCAKDVEITKNIYRNMAMSHYGANPGFTPAIKNVIFNNPATIVFWADGTKTVVKCQDDDEFDMEKGLAMAISKKALGNRGNYNEVFKKWCVDKDEEERKYLEQKFRELKKKIEELSKRM